MVKTMYVMLLHLKGGIDINLLTIGKNLLKKIKDISYYKLLSYIESVCAFAIAIVLIAGYTDLAINHIITLPAELIRAILFIQKYEKYFLNICIASFIFLCIFEILGVIQLPINPNKLVNAILQKLKHISHGMLIITLTLKAICDCILASQGKYNIKNTVLDKYIYIIYIFCYAISIFEYIYYKNKENIEEYQRQLNRRPTNYYDSKKNLIYLDDHVIYNNYEYIVKYDFERKKFCLQPQLSMLNHSNLGKPDVLLEIAVKEEIIVKKDDYKY